MKKALLVIIILSALLIAGCGDEVKLYNALDFEGETRYENIAPRSRMILPGLTSDKAGARSLTQMIRDDAMETFGELYEALLTGGECDVMGTLTYSGSIFSGVVRIDVTGTLASPRLLGSVILPDDPPIPPSTTYSASYTYDADRDEIVSATHSADTPS